MRSTLLITAVVLLLVPAVAAAWTPPPRTADGQLALYLPIARAAWPDSPCTGREKVYLNSQDAITEWGEDAQGMADPSTCEVWMSPGVERDPQTFCSNLVHEAGHLAGYEHTGEDGLQAPAGPQSRIMASTGGLWYSWPACTAAIVPRHMREELVYNTWLALPLSQRGARIDCGEDHCLVRGAAMRPRYYEAIYDPDADGWTVGNPIFRSRPSKRAANGSSRTRSPTKPETAR